jgi:hypothetical protein
MNDAMDRKFVQFRKVIFPDIKFCNNVCVGGVGEGARGPGDQGDRGAGVCK